MNASEGLALLAVVVALGTAIVSWKWLQRADDRTREANDTAIKALKLAEAAEDRAQRLESLSAERRDVRWDQDELDDVDDRFALRNVGTDAAHNVHLVVDFPEHPQFPRREQEHGTVDGRDPIGMHVTAEVREATMGLPIRATVTWTSTLGVPGIKTFAFEL